MIVLAAVAYTLHCLRLETHAQKTSSPFPLAAAKVVTETVWLSLLFVAVLLLAATSSGSSSSSGW